MDFNQLDLKVQCCSYLGTIEPNQHTRMESYFHRNRKPPPLLLTARPVRVSSA